MSSEPAKPNPWQGLGFCYDGDKTFTIRRAMHTSSF